jgi:L-galactose dehydrogenase
MFEPNGTKETTAIGLGGAAINWESHETGVAIVKEALDAGVRYFDTSPGYCGGDSQVVFGKGLRDAPDETMVATKLGYFEDPADFTNEDAIRRQITENLELLQREKVDLLQVHEANWECWWRTGADRTQISPEADFDFNNAPVMRALREAKAKGLCDRIGITGNVADQMSHIFSRVEVDTLLIAFNFDLIHRGAFKQAVPLAKERDAAVIIGAIFYMGRMAVPHPEWLSEPPEWMTGDLKSRYERLYALQSESGLSLVEMSVRFTLSHPDPSVILVGVKNHAELEESLEAAEAGALPDDLYREIDALGTMEY